MWGKKDTKDTMDSKENLTWIKKTDTIDTMDTWENLTRIKKD